MPENQSFDAIVVGAGPAGVAAAITLAKTALKP
jgi:flavin-dependent dehydrogenase